MQVPLLRLQCGVNSYAWGKKGHDSTAAKFAAATPAGDFSIQSDKPYSELWMGTHPSNPSKDLTTGRTLLDLVQDNKALLSDAVTAKYGETLPFLLKILSIDTALSIQAHPNKKLAEELHARDPKNYPDDNHKPEMAIAVTPFEGLCGFRPLAEIAHFLETVSPLKALVGAEFADEFIANAKAQAEDASEEATAKSKKILQKTFGSLMASSQSDVDAETEKLIKLADSEGANFAAGGVPSISGEKMAALVRRLYGQYGNDIGLFVQFFLNYVELQPGEALFLTADDIHAYISGDIVECMASSDNVIRAGFTPKYKDVSTLVSTLTYNFAPIEEQKMKPTEYPYATLNRTGYSSSSSVTLYDPPIDEFAVIRTTLNGDGAKATFEPIQGPSVVICTKGKGKISVGPKVEDMEEGYVYFVGATAELVLESRGGPDDEFVTFKAFCEVE
ncbi:Mannose-6-phosphate isomerase [Scedosporium apiospermum]|uniref:Mannose-6-phosphate isomerase n=1 Tax=Pseudallescheria apiosperma TaxID=563466 RepID=A0A084GD05_PSEDA|nr:Mannose-6-phosphate isomerase [Scedosporium apiospermum]KEZ45217.1 Mannose-6-phosphate isomerase [Scedosporium apiospermum]